MKENIEFNGEKLNFYQIYKIMREIVNEYLNLSYHDSYVFPTEDTTMHDFIQRKMEENDNELLRYDNNDLEKFNQFLKEKIAEIEEIKKQEKEGNNKEEFKNMRQEKREEMIHKLSERTIEIVKENIMANDESFLYDIIRGNGWKPYEQLTDEELEKEYKEEFF
jgi:hypothetical protein